MIDWKICLVVVLIHVVYTLFCMYCTNEKEVEHVNPEQDAVESLYRAEISRLITQPQLVFRDDQLFFDLRITLDENGDVLEIVPVRTWHQPVEPRERVDWAKWGF
jgi:hypothetical protein